MRKVGPDAGKPPIVAGRIALLAAAAVLSVVAGYQTHRIWRSLPGVRLARLDSDLYSRALENARRSMPVEARDGLIAANVSTLFTASRRDPTVLAGHHSDARRLTAELRRTQLGRLQLAAFTLLELERAGTPAAQWWPALQPLLTGLERAPLGHHLQSLIAHRAAVFESLGFGAGSAYAEAAATVGHPHGPFLEYLVPRLRQMASAQQEGGPQAATACCQLRRRLLQQWVLEPGPVDLRLLAADLLAADIESAATPGNRPADDSLATRLRAWRAAYHQAVAARPMPVMPISIQVAPEPCPPQYGGLVTSIADLLWAAAATTAAAAVTLLVLILGRRTALTTPLRAWACAGPVGILAIVLVAGLYWSSHPVQTVGPDLRRFVAEDLGWPRAPLVAGALTVGLLALTLMPRSRHGARLARIAGTATTVWLILCLWLLAGGWFARQDLKEYELHVGAALKYNEAAAATGVPITELLEELQAWQPDCSARP